MFAKPASLPALRFPHVTCHTCIIGQGTGLGRFRDIDQLTTFADYRVPCLLAQMGILRYSPALQGKVRRVAVRCAARACR